MAAQVKASPASTQAPEAFLVESLKDLSEKAKKIYNIFLLRSHDKIPDIIRQSHRFRSMNGDGYFELAKDLARLTADIFDVKEIQKIAKTTKGQTFSDTR